MEVGHNGPAVAVRDTKDPDGPALAFTPAGWQAFTRAIREGRPLTRRRRAPRQLQGWRGAVTRASGVQRQPKIHLTGQGTSLRRA